MHVRPGVYVGDELLGGEITVSNLSSIFEYIKQGDPSLITYYNEEWAPINDPEWRDAVGEPFGKLPTSLDWISYDFYRCVLDLVDLGVNSTSFQGQPNRTDMGEKQVE